MAIRSDQESRLDQIVAVWSELNRLVQSFDYELALDGQDLDVTNLHGEYLFTLDTLNESDY